MEPDNHDTLKIGASLPDRQNNYETAYREAAAGLASLTIDEIAGKSGAAIIPHNGGKALILSFIGDEVMVAHPEIAVSRVNRGEDVPLWAKILILHYLVRAGGAPARGEQITFKQLDGGLGYYPAFQRRCVSPLLEAFGSSPAKFMEAGALAGGEKSSHGRHALTFRAFPKAAVTFIIWDGEEEFPPTGGVIFDSSITDYLSTEDVAVLCNMVAVKIIKSGSSMKT